MTPFVIATLFTIAIERGKFALRKQRFSSTGFIHNAPRLFPISPRGTLWIKPFTLDVIIDGELARVRFECRVALSLMRDILEVYERA
jgi:hypothetical protein